MSDTQRLKDALKGNGALLRDPRIDRAVSWVLTTLVGLAVVWASGSLSEVRADLKRVGESVQKLEIRFAEQSIVVRQVEDHERRLRRLEGSK